MEPVEEGNFLYLKVYHGIKNSISSGEYPPGARLPSEAALCRQYGTSAITIKKAFAMLVEEGYVRRVPGRGTFVEGETQEPEPDPEPEKSQPVRNPALIGMILEHVSSPFGLDMMYTIDRELTRRGYKLCVRYSYGERARETEEIQFLQSLGVAGLIIMPCHGSHYSTAVLRLIIDAFPVVLIDKKLEGIPVPSVRTDNEGAGACLVQHLYACGCRLIGIVSNDASGATSLMERVTGILRAQEETGLETTAPCFVRTERELVDNRPDPAVVAQLRAYLTRNDPVLDGLICTEFGLMSCLIEAGRQEGIPFGPDGVRVCCVDEDYLAPGGFRFTHVKQDEQAIGVQAVDLLEERLNGSPSAGVGDILIPARFVRGAST